MNYATSNSIKNQNRFPMQPKATGRSQLSLNIRKLVDVMEIDLLSASLGIRESVLRDILSGKENGDTYRQFLEQKLDEAGFASHWLDRANAQLFPDQIKELKLLASTSTQKAPLRRNNLKTLMLAFDGKLDILADALDVVQNSLLKVAEGELILDDQRFGHFNPRLVEAGFPDGWLDLPQAKVEDEWAQGLVRMAADQYESYLSSVEEKQNTLPLLAVSSTPSITSNITMATNPVTPGSKVDTASMISNAPPPVAGKGKNSLLSSIFAPRNPQAKPIRDPEIDKSQELAPTPASAPVKTESAPTEKATPYVLKGSTPPTLSKKTAEVAAPVKADVFGRAGTAMSPAAIMQEAQRKEQAQQQQTPKASKADTVSSLRAARFEALMDKAHRGLRTYIWHDLLQKKLAHFYSIKEGVNRFTDEQANAITQALGLPQGWLDDPQGDLMIALPWVYDKSLPMVLGGVKTTTAEEVAKAVAPYVLPKPAKIITQLKPAKEEKAGKAKPVAEKVAAKPEVISAMPEVKREEVKEVVAAPAAPVASAPVVAAPVVQAVSAPATAAPMLAAASQAKGNLGILVTALLNTIELHALQGKFTEQDALDLIYKLQTK